MLAMLKHCVTLHDSMLKLYTHPPQDIPAPCPMPRVCLTLKSCSAAKSR